MIAAGRSSRTVLAALAGATLAAGCDLTFARTPPNGDPPPDAIATTGSALAVNWDLLGGGRIAWSDELAGSLVVLDAATRQVTKIAFASLRAGSALTFWPGSLALQPAGDRISFVANFDSSWPSRAFVTAIGGGSTVGLAPVDVQCTSSFWAPDGRAVFFLTGVTDGVGSQSDAVARSNADGTQFTRVIPIARFPGKRLWGHGAVSPDGTRLALAAPNDGIYLASIDGRSITRIAASPAGRFEYGPVWSPDGTRIAFASDLAPMSSDIGASGPVDLVVMSADGSGRSTVASLPAGLVCQPFVAWSPGGNKLAFNSCAFDADISAHVSILDLDTGTTAPLTSGSGVFADGPSWAP